MLLFELFDSKAKLKEVRDDEDVNYVGQLSDGTHLQIMFAYMGRGGQYELSFSRGRRADFADTRLDKTGMGNEAEVFGVVVQAVGQFIAGHDPESISFTADKSSSDPSDTRKMSRTNLYGRMLSRIRNPDYTVKKVTYGGFDEYKIIKRDSDAHSEADQFQQTFGDDLS